MKILSENKVNISILDINRHLWMYSICPEEATHRICVDFNLNGEDYIIDQWFNINKIGIQKILRSIAMAVERKIKEI